MKRLKLILTVFLLFAITALTFGAEQKQLTKIRLANLAVGLSSAPHEIGIAKGIFKKYGIDLEVINFIKGGAEATAGVASGQIDIGSYGTPILTGISRGLPIKIIAAPAVKGNTFVLVGRKGIKSVKDLKGKIVATGALGGGNHQALLKILAGNGLKESDVQVVATGGTDASLILQSGRVDAAITTEPTVSLIVTRGIGSVLAEAEDYYGRYEHSYVFATTNLINSNPQVIKNFLKASRESYEYSKNHFEELVAKGKELTGLDDGIIREYYKKDIKKWDLSYKIDLEGTANAVKILKELKEIDPEVVFNQKTWIDNRFLK